MWEDLEVSASFSIKQNEEAFATQSKVWAPSVGLTMFELPQSIPTDLTYEISIGLEPLRREVKFALYTLVFDGKAYTIEKTDVSVPAGETTITLK